MAIKDDADERLGRQAADEAVAVPLREGLDAAVEHQIARRNHRYPIEDGLCQVGPRVGIGNGHAVIVLAIGDERPAIILALLDQVQLVSAARAMLDLPQFAGGGKRQAVGCADAAGPGFGRRQIGAGKGVGAYYLRGLGGFGVTGRIDQRNGGGAGLAEVGVARGGFAVQRQAQDLAYGLVRILGGGHALAVANSQE